ncbi:MAG: hypothetical protein AVDCRST_MAG64-607 [uncultured Phycisphaerae bacterium]|uniref:Uncharacterized protein n=1 Tax=uncultured Phycisphaerae bacterium TaxID=904963 RepID=A0A6J4NBZ3_9BACT|nr:MAG: hypothetical protein AVDCRST_MAG64-607 [uncultured Phycisphaerae bacterium]
MANQGTSRTRGRRTGPAELARPIGGTRASPVGTGTHGRRRRGLRRYPAPVSHRSRLPPAPPAWP